MTMTLRNLPLMARGTASEKVAGLQTGTCPPRIIRPPCGGTPEAPSNDRSHFPRPRRMRSPMQLTVRPTGAWQHTLDIQIPPDEVERGLDDVARKVQPP